jgi:putative membrane protein
MMNAIATVLIADTWGMHGGDFGAGWMVLMMGLMVLFWAAVILGIVWLVRGGSEGSRERRAQSRTPTATELLERRFAEGAISADEYRERRELIAGEGRR